MTAHTAHNGANLSGANLSKADLSGAELTQTQLDAACGDANTKPPEGLKPPKPCPPARVVSGCVNPHKGGVIATKGADRPL